MYKIYIFLPKTKLENSKRKAFKGEKLLLMIVTACLLDNSVFI